MALSAFQRNAYASGAFTKSTLWNFTDFLLLFYLTEIVGMDVASAGFILMVSLVVSGMLDISLAVILDRYRCRYPKVIAFSAPFTVISFALLFYPVNLPEEGHFTYYLCATLAFRVGYALVDIPHNAMLSTLSSDTHERTRLSSARIFFNSCAILLFAYFAGDVLAVLEAPTDTVRIIILASCCFSMLVNLFICILPVWQAEQPATNAHSRSLTRAFGSLMNNRAFVVLALYTLVPCIFIPVFYKSGVYFASMLLGDEKLSTWLIMSLATGKLVALPAFVRMAAVVEKSHAMIIAHGGMIAVMLWFIIWTPESVFSLSLLFFIFGLFSGGLMALIWAALPDTIEFGLQQTGVANPALTFGTFHLVMRISDGMSFAVIAGILAFAETQSTGGAELFADGIAVTSVLGCILGAVILLYYPLTHAVHRQMVANIVGNRRT